MNVELNFVQYVVLAALRDGAPPRGLLAASTQHRALKSLLKAGLIDAPFNGLVHVPAINDRGRAAIVAFELAHPRQQKAAP